VLGWERETTSTATELLMSEIYLMKMLLKVTQVSTFNTKLGHHLKFNRGCI